MLTGAHTIIYSKDADADRAFLRSVLGLPHVDVGEGWLIFGLPPSEVAVHPAEHGGEHELYLMCEDVEKFVAAMARQGIVCDAVQDQGWGRLTAVTLPGGGKLGVYEPRHARPASPVAGKPARRAATRSAVARRAPARKTRPKGAARRAARRPPAKRPRR